MKCNLIIIMLLALLIPNICHAHVQSGLVGWWKFDEASGNAIDSSGSGNTGTPVATTIVANCKRAGCRNFNSNNNRIPINTTGWDSSTGTLAFWARPTALDTSVSNGIPLCAIGSDGSCGSGNRLYIRLNSDVVHLGIGGSSNVNTAYTPVLGQWAHYALTYNAGNYVFYVNGIQINASTYTNVLTFTTAFIGGTALAATYTGDSDDIRVYNRVLTAVEVMDLYKAGSVISGAVIGGGRINQ